VVQRLLGTAALRRWRNVWLPPAGGQIDTTSRASFVCKITLSSAIVVVADRIACALQHREKIRQRLRFG